MRRILTILLVLSVAFPAAAQSTKDIRINEILVKNVDNYVDDYGHRSSWIELHNTSHGRIDIGGCYLRAVTSFGDTTVYRIPTGDPKTVMSPLGYVVFFCEGTGTKGTLYTNFTLDNIASVSLLNASGKGTPIDEVVIDYSSQLADVSVGRFTDEDGNVTFSRLPKTTPNATNDTEEMVHKSEKFRLRDPYGAIMTITAISIVLCVLTLLFLFFKLLGNYMVSLTKKKVAAVAKVQAEAAEMATRSYESPTSGDEIVAIAMALQMFREDLHDKESSVITINRVARAYSPWSSKIYGLRQNPRK